MKARETHFHPQIRLLLIALLVVLVHYSVPYGQYILYPFNLLFTWVHEMGHGIMALLCGGKFQFLEILKDASGQAHLLLRTDVSSLQRALVSAGGLLAPPFIGMLLLLSARSFARVVLFLFQLALAASLLIWVRSPEGSGVMGVLWSTGVMGVLWALFLAISLWATPIIQSITVQFLGLVLSLYTIVRIDYLFMGKAHVGSQVSVSDISKIAENLGGPVYAWGLLLTLLSICFLGIGLYMAWRTPQKHKTPIA